MVLRVQHWVVLSTRTNMPHSRCSDFPSLKTALLFCFRCHLLKGTWFQFQLPAKQTAYDVPGCTFLPWIAVAKIFGRFLPMVQFMPKIADAAAVCSDSEKLPSFSRRGILVSRMLMEASSFTTCAIFCLSMQVCITSNLLTNKRAILE